MKLDLRENMYVRTKDGIIDKILKLNKSYVKGVSQKDELYAYDIDNIVKASYNIIDILEVGDYVNGSKVMKTHCKLEYIDDDSDTGVNEVDDGLELENGWIYFEYEVESIVTHEQMEQMAYKVGD